MSWVKPNPMKFKNILFRGFACCVTAGLLSNVFAAPAPATLQSIDRLENISPGQISVRLDSATEVASFIRFETGAVDTSTAVGSSFSDKTRSFLAEHGTVLGLSNQDSELVLAVESADSRGRGRTRYRQVYQGIPVFGAELTSLFDRNGQLIAISSSTYEVPDVNINPGWNVTRAALIARDHVARQGSVRASLARLESTNAELMIFRTGLARGIPGTNHLAYRFEVVSPSRNVREFVFVDAHSGKVLDQISGIHQALDRKVSEETAAELVWQDSENNPDPIPAEWANGTAQMIIDWQDEIDGASETYHLFASMTTETWLSYDGQDATMRTINNDPGIDCPNASWDGFSTNYCSGVTGDDTVAHEWGHAYTEYTANLIYQWQPGALNESYSDVWGEVVDMLNERGTDSPDIIRTAGSCSLYGNGTPKNDDSYRWLSGEDDPAFGGAIRDMWNPLCYGDPGKVSDSRYWCTAGDNGGVHINSGVPNHGFALIVDGGEYNETTITGLGLTKAAHIYWESLQILVPTSDFPDHADAVEASCTSLIDSNLAALSTDDLSPGLSGEIITIEDCEQVALAMTAVELREEPVQCGFDPLLENNPPERCLNQGEFHSIALTDWESGLGAWTVSTYGIANPLTFDTPDWAIVDELPSEREGSAAFVANLNIGNCEDDDETGALALEGPVISVPAETVALRMSFNHWMSSERDWDGGNLKMSVNGGEFDLVPGSAFEVSPYNDTLFPLLGLENTNPMAGQDAFTGADGGTLNGSWGQSQIALAGLAEAGDDIQLRFDFGVDACSGAVGWYVDDVEVYTCSDEFSPLCGNGVLDSIEQCDDGNNEDSDGCSAVCEIEEGWLCTVPIPATSIPDHSFEAGPNGGVWDAASIEFGSPICNENTCGLGNGTGPSDGDYWAWFGGIEKPEASYEESSLSQSITIDAGVTELTFDLEVFECDSASDYLELSIDGTQVFFIDGADPACGTLGHAKQSVDISAYADDGTHNLQFYSESFTVNNFSTNFFVDNLAIPGIPSQCALDSGVEFESTPEAGSTLDFGSHVVGSVSGIEAIAVSNPGIADLELTCSLSGADAGQFALVDCDSPIAASGTGTVSATCSPDSVGEKLASLDIETNDFTEPTVSFPLSCTGITEPVVPYQVITAQPLIQVVAANAPVSVEAHYSTSDANESLSGLELRVHWDSTQLGFVALSSVWASDLVSSDNACQADIENYDRDSSTDCYAAVVWFSAGGEFPGAGTTPTILFSADFTGTLSPASSTSVNFSRADQVDGYLLNARSAVVEEETIGPQVLFSDGFED